MRHLRPLLFVLLLFLIHCAGQSPPPGGPVDTIPPVIIRSVPDSGAIRVSEAVVELEFSEYVDRRSVEDAVFISPPIGQPEFDWSGKALEIRFPDTLRAQTTYVVTVGTDVIDQRAKNRMASGYTLAFSTGDSLDRGRLSGQVYDKDPEAVTVFAYRLDRMNADTLDPTRVKPDYVMQTGKDGRFVFSSLAWGMYRLFAIRDEYRNLLYDRQLDQFGVFNRDLVLSGESPSVEGIRFQLTKEDTTAPFLSSVQSVSGRRISFRFSEPIDTAKFGSGNVTVIDTATGTRQLIQAVFLDPANPSEGGALFTTSLTTSAVYRFTVSQIADTAGWPIDSLNASLLFIVSEVPDTLAPVFSFLSFADTVMGYPVDRPLEIRFDEPVVHSSFANGLTLSDTGGTSLPVMLEWLNPVWLRVSPPEPLRFAARYQVVVVLDSVIDFDRNSENDSVRTIRFATLDPERSGELEGSVQDLNLGGDGPVVVTAIRISDRRETEVIQESPGRFLFPVLPGGAYVITAFRDEDRSGEYSYGRPFPFQSSERFAVGLDTVKVRPRWSVEGLLLAIP